MLDNEENDVLFDSAIEVNQTQVEEQLDTTCGSQTDFSTKLQTEIEDSAVSEGVASEPSTKLQTEMEHNTISEEAESELPQQEPTAIISQSLMRRIEAERTQRERVNEWKAFIGDKLSKADKRADFDIHEYGSQIIDSIPESGNRKFKDVVAGKSAAEVSRYFLATLQLANTYNVEIKQPCEGRMATDTLELKLLSRERYHESLDDYVAPSEESFQERLVRAQTHISSIPFSSTPKKSAVKGGGAKRPRFSSESPSTSGVKDKTSANARYGRR